VRRLSVGARRLLILSLAAVVLGLWQAKAPRSFLLGDVSAWAARPAERGFEAAGAEVSDWWRALVGARRGAEQVRSLRHELSSLRQENLTLAEQRLENARLRRLLDLRGQVGGRSVAVEVIGRKTDPRGELLIARGRRDGIRVGAPVLAPDGLLGQVERVSAVSAWVLPLVSSGARAGALVERTRQAGMAVGDGHGYRIEDMDPEADLRPGDLVITSGAGGVYPKGVAIGRISRVRREPGLSRASAEVGPLVSWREVEEVLVVIY
jgi:rod shape-determining protein MreC